MKRLTFLFLLLLAPMLSMMAQKIYSVDYENQADVKVYVVEYENQADLKIYFVRYENQAGWEKRSKMHLLYSKKG